MSRRRRKTPITRIGHWLVILLVISSVGSVAFVYLRWLTRIRRYNQLIEQVAARQGIDKFLIKAVMRAESGFDPYARSRTGAIGLMQVMPSTGQLFGYTKEQLWQERANIEAGTAILAHALAYWRTQPVDNPLPFVLAEYNAGRGTVLRWAPQGKAQAAELFVQNLPNAGVRRYIERVSNYYLDYRDAGRL